MKKNQIIFLLNKAVSVVILVFVNNQDLDNFIFEEINDDDHDLTFLMESYPFTQANFYGKWQKTFGRGVRKFIVRQGKDVISFMQVIEYPLIFGKKFAYIPYGPIIKDNSEALMVFIKDNIKKTYSGNTVFVRYDFFPTLNLEQKKYVKKHLLQAPKFAQNSAMFQPRLEWVLPLEKGEDEILIGMHKNTRYSLRVSEKNNIKSEIVTGDIRKYFDDFFELMQKTARRNHFSLHSRRYYEVVFESIENNKNGFLVLAKDKDKIVVAELFLVCASTVTYLFAGSDDESRASCPTYSAQWAAIRYSKKMGLKYYNFGGISEEGDKKSGWYGLTSFKKKFGGEEVRHSDFYDLIINPIWYALYFVGKLVK